MVDDDMDVGDDVKRNMILFVCFVCVCVFLYVVFVIGASYSCVSGGGSLQKNVNGMKCIDLDSVDLCRDYTGKVIEKPEPRFNATFNMSPFYDSIGD